MRLLLFISSILLLGNTSCRKDIPLVNEVNTDFKKELKTEHVIVLVIDGPRISETWEEPEKKHIPYQAGYFAQHGVVYENFRNNGPTYTLAGHTAISTGTYQEIDNGGNELPMNSSIFQAYLKKSGLPSEAAWIISSKPKISVLANCEDKEWKDSYNPRTDCGINGESREDNETMKKAIAIFSEHHPKLALVQLREPDYSGHANDWDNYIKGIENSDRLAMELWKFIESDSVYAGKTTLLITNDHGRHSKGRLNGFVSHGDDCAGCRNIMLVGIGPDFKAGKLVRNSGEQVDISTTISSMMNIEGFKSQGKVLQDLFQNKVVQ